MVLLRAIGLSPIAPHNLINVARITRERLAASESFLVTLFGVLICTLSCHGIENLGEERL